MQTSITSAASTGGTGVNNGQALGPDIFLMSSGVIIFNQSTTFTINTAIAGNNGVGGGSTTAGGIIMNGTGTLVLGGNNTFSGSTTINAGTTKISSDGNLGTPASAVNLETPGGILEFTASTTLNSSRTVNITGPGTILLDPGVTAGISGVIDGGGSLTVNGAGTLIFSGTSTYTGGTTISSSPSTLQINAPLAFPPTGNVLDNGHLVFNFSGSGVYADNISGTGTLTVQGGGTVGLSGTNTYSGVTTIAPASTLQIDAAAAISPNSSVTDNGNLVFNYSGPGSYSGNVSGSGALTVQNGGTVSLSGTNTYTNGTTIALSSTLQINAPAALPTAGNIADNGSLVFNFNAAGSYSGVISGTGSLTVQNGGTVALSGINTYSGGTTLDIGILQISNPANIGSGQLFFNGGELELLPGFGSGAIGNAMLVSPSGGTILSDVSAASTVTFSGPVNALSSGGTLSINQTAASTLVLSGTISGGNSLAKNGPGTVILSGSNTYTGQTTISAGTLQINSRNGLSSTGNVIDNSHLVFNFGGSVPGSVSGVISGTGDLTMQGSGILQLRNSGNSYSGGTLFNAGTIQAFDSGSLGTGPLIFNGGTLEISGTFLTSQTVILDAPGGTVQVDMGTFGVLAGMSTGTGGLTTKGPGVLFLGGANNYTGPTTVQSGTLVVEAGASINASAVTVQIATLVANGTIASPLLVDFGGTLMGTGTVGNATINGIIEPGVNSIGTLHGSNFLLNGSSSYFLQLNNTTSDLIAASSSVTINGGTLRLFPVDLTTPQVTSYTIITAPTVTVDSPFILINPLTRFIISVVYDPSDVKLVIMGGGPIPFHVLIPKGNAGSVAKCFDVLVAENLPDMNEIVSILNLQTASQIQHSLNQMQPANFNNIYLAEENVAERIRQIYTSHFFEQRVVSCPETEAWRLWAAPFVERARQHGKGSLPGYLERFSGFSAALDYRFQKHWMLTGGFSYASTEMNVPNGRASANFKTYAGSVGAAWTGFSFFADALFSYLYSDVEAKRKMHFAVSNFALTDTVNRTAKHHDGSNQVLGHLGFGYDFKMNANSSNTFNVTPFANIDYLYIPQDGYTEHGAQSLRSQGPQQALRSAASRRRHWNRLQRML